MACKPPAVCRSVVVDNTTSTEADREPLLALGKQYSATISGYSFEPAVGASRKRNCQREGKARVPDVAILATRKRLPPPTYAEGFDRLFIVTIPKPGVFLVRKLS